MTDVDQLKADVGDLLYDSLVKKARERAKKRREIEDEENRRRIEESLPKPAETIGVVFA